MMKTLRQISTYILVMIGLSIYGCRKEASKITADNSNWSVYLGGDNSNQFASLKQINRTNVDRLKVAWTYHSSSGDTKNFSQIQCNPLIIDGILFGTSPELMLFALNAETGKLIWEF